MTEEAKPFTRVDQAFADAWPELGDDPEICSEEDKARKIFVAGARAFSTMPLCEHGVAVWGVEYCDFCAKSGSPGEFPGYNRPFETDLPEGMTAGDLEDLKAEHEAMRRCLLQAMVKVGALDPDGVNAPWDGVRLIHFVGLWLSNALPFVRTPRALTVAINELDQRVSTLEAATAPEEPPASPQEKTE